MTLRQGQMLYFGRSADDPETRADVNSCILSRRSTSSAVMDGKDSEFLPIKTPPLPQIK